MNASICRYFPSFFLLFFLLSCGEASTENPVTGTSNESTFNPSAGQDSAADQNSSTENVPPQTEEPETNEPAGACTNETDLALIESGAVAEEANRCGPGCVLNGTQCTIDCMTEAIDISQPCAGCYAEMVSCSATNCAMSCFVDSEGEECRSCVDENCGAPFEECTGLDSEEN